MPSTHLAPLHDLLLVLGEGDLDWTPRCRAPEWLDTARCVARIDGVMAFEGAWPGLRLLTHDGTLWKEARRARPAVRSARSPSLAHRLSDPLPRRGARGVRPG